MKDQTVHMIGNAHIDAVWLWQWQEGFQEVKATFRSALDRLRESDDFVFTSSSAAYYWRLEGHDPGMFEEIKARVAEGRWVICGGWWVQPDTNIPSGESLVRHGLYSQRYLREKLGTTATVGYTPTPSARARPSRRSCTAKGWTLTSSCDPSRTRSAAPTPRLARTERSAAIRRLTAARRIPFRVADTPMDAFVRLVLWTAGGGAGET